MAVFPVPVVAAANVPHPSAVLLPPVVVAVERDQPLAVLLAPVVLARSALTPRGRVGGAGGVGAERRRRWPC